MEERAAFIVRWEQHPAIPGEIHAIGIIDNGKDYVKALIRVVFQDYFYLLLEEPLDAKQLDSLRYQLRGEATFSYKMVKTLFGYQPEPEVPALLFLCNDAATLLKHKAIKSLGGKPEETTMFSRSRKLTAMKQMSQCCWVPLARSRVISEDSEERLSRNGNLEFKFDNWADFTSLPLDRIEHFAPPPGSLLKTLSFDIEAYKPSDRGGGMPDPAEPRNIVLCISCVVDYAGKRDHIFLTVSDVPDRSLLPEETIVKLFEHEKDMIYGFFEEIARINPIILMGFNTQSWDFRYLNERLTKVHKMKYPLSLGIYKTPPAIKMKYSFWSSEAFRDNDIAYPDIPGIVHLDLHKFYARTRPKMKHSLNFISQTYLGRGKYDMSQMRMAKAYESQDPQELSLLAQYNVNDSVLVADLYLKQKIFEEAAIEALTCETVIDDLYTKGMGIRAQNQLYKEAKLAGYVVTDTYGNDEDGKLIGAHVTEPEPGLYDDVAIFDVQSMYPSIVIMLNLCYSTYVRPDQLKHLEPDDYQTLTWETRVTSGKETRVEEHQVHFVTDDTDKKRVGVCKKLISDQIALRMKVKEWSKDATQDAAVRMIMKMVQKAIKMTSNSLIGLWGTSGKMSKLTFPACAGVVYTRARNTIVQVIKAVNEGFEPVIYSDTDSIMVKNMSSPDRRRELVTWLNKEYAPLTFEFENVGKLLILSAKNYIFKTDGDIKYVGVAFSKRNNCYFVVSTLKEIVDMIFRGESKDRILEYANHRNKEIQEEDPADLAMTATVTTAVNSLGNKLARKGIAAGNIILPGDVIEYIVLKETKKRQPLGERVISLENFMKDPTLQIDYSYYSEQFMTHVGRIMIF